MIRRLSTTDELVMAERLRDVFVSGEASLAAEWLARSTARVMVQESGRPLEHEEAPLVAQTFAAAGVEKLFAISIDSLLATPEAYDLATSADNLRQISDEFLWVSFILMDPAAHYCILFTAYDFKLIVGSSTFVASIAGEPRAARKSFLELWRINLIRCVRPHLVPSST